MTTTSEIGLDGAAVEEFALRIMGHYTSGMLAFMIDLGHRTGLFAAAADGPFTSEELAGRAGLNERYVREWLGALVTGGIIEYDPDSATYQLPPVHAACLTGDLASNVAPLAQMNTHLGKHLHLVADAFREGGGVPYSAYRPEFTDVLDAAGRGLYDALLVDAWVPAVPGLVDRLTAGARVADVGCGTGHALVLLARAFPASTFVGYDFAEDAIERARAEAASEGLTNVSFEVRDAATLTVDQPFDVVMTIDAIHDQARPAEVLSRIFAALVPGGTYVMAEPAASSNLEDNLANPLAPWIYGISTLHCMTVSLAEGGTGLGTAWGWQRAHRMLADAGFGEVTMIDAPGDAFDTLHVTTRP